MFTLDIYYPKNHVHDICTYKYCNTCTLITRDKEARFSFISIRLPVKKEIGEQLQIKS